MFEGNWTVVVRVSRMATFRDGKNPGVLLRSWEGKQFEKGQERRCKTRVNSEAHIQRWRVEYYPDRVVCGRLKHAMLGGSDVHDNREK